MIMFIIYSGFLLKFNWPIFTFLFFILFLGYSSSAKPSRKRCQNWIQSGCPLSTDMLIHLCGISPSRQQAMRGTFFPCMPVGTYLNLKDPRNKVTKSIEKFWWISQFLQLIFNLRGHSTTTWTNFDPILTPSLPRVDKRRLLITANLWFKKIIILFSTW